MLSAHPGRAHNRPETRRREPMRFLSILPAAVGLAGFVVLVAIVAGLDFAITGSWGLS